MTLLTPDGMRERLEEPDIYLPKPYVPLRFRIAEDFVREFAAVYLRNTLDEPLGWCPVGMVRNCWMHDGNAIRVHECDASSVEMPPVTTWGATKALYR